MLFHILSLYYKKPWKLELWLYLEMQNSVLNSGPSARVFILYMQVKERKKIKKKVFLVLKKKRENQRVKYEKCYVWQTWSYGGTMLATLRTTKASPGWKSRTCDGQTLESEHANTINCPTQKPKFITDKLIIN